MVRTKPGQKIHVDTLQTTWEKLEQLETKPKSELNLRESILFLKDKLNSALKKGYSYQDLSEILSGVCIATEKFWSVRSGTRIS